MLWSHQYKIRTKNVDLYKIQTKSLGFGKDNKTECSSNCFMSKDKKKQLLGLLKEEVVLTSVLNLDGSLHMCMYDQVFKYESVT